MARDLPSTPTTPRLLVEKNAHTVLLRLALPPYTIHFQSPTHLHPPTLDLLDKRICKHTLRSTAHDSLVREAVGRDAKFWRELSVLLRAAVPSLERRCFEQGDFLGGGGGGVDYESTRGGLIAGHYPGLWRDLERLNDLLSISRNCLTVGAAVQDLAAEAGVDTEVFRLVNCCVRVTARGYDGDAAPGEEEKWQWVVNAYKKLLITSLQFLNNLVARNERRKLGLWVALFDNSLDDGGGGGEEEVGEESERERQQVAPPPPPPPPPAAPPPTRPSPPITAHDIMLAYGSNGSSHLSPLEMEAAQPLHKSEGFKPLPPQVSHLVKKSRYEPNGYVYFVHMYRDLLIREFQETHKRVPMLAEAHLNLPRYWQRQLEAPESGFGGDGGKKLWEAWGRRYEQALDKYRADLDAYENPPPPPPPPHTPQPKAVDAPPPPLLPTPPPTKPQHNDPRIVSERIKVLEAMMQSRYNPNAGEMSYIDHPALGLDSDAQALVLTTPGMLDPMRRGEERDDRVMLFTADAGAKILESGKAELMKRLEGEVEGEGDGDVGVGVGVGKGGRRRSERSLSLSEAFASSAHVAGVGQRERGSLGSLVGSEEEEEEEEEEEQDEEEEEEESEDEDAEDDEEDYPGSTEDGRGLLTDVPLILGPSEIEVLPMLIMSGIVPPTDPPSTSADESNTAEVSTPQPNHTLRTHLLLTQTPGRNLLRELLIFVAAWDLREEELYFKFLLKIMEAILDAGLLPYAYWGFRDRSKSRDIISPAQAVVLKLVTGIFRGRHVAAVGGDKGVVGKMAVPSKVDLHVLNFIFTEFRQHIIPQTCALIFLQGQIHKGRAGPEDFPLNLWDMERMYEGVYQYLEFFAVLTEEQPRQNEGDVEEEGEEDTFSWKKILAEWEMASELVTLLRELEDGIPKLGALPPVQQVPRRISSHPAPPPSNPTQRSLSADAAIQPVSVERPFDLSPDPTTTTTHHPIFEPETPLAYPPSSPPPTTSHLDPTTPSDLPQHHDQDEPSDFEWRNLKKLTVLVLSSLLFKNAVVQRQVRESGGLEALVKCCERDEHNPFIREHAIMCLRFAVEGDEGCRGVVQRMAERGRGALEGGSVTLAPTTEDVGAGDRDGDGAVAVPKEVLDTEGYETFMDGKGQVGLRRKVEEVLTSNTNNGNRPAAAVPVQPGAAPTTTTTTSSSISGRGVPEAPLPSLPPPPPPRLTTTKMTAEKAAELMQNALRDLPLGDKLVTDRQKAEALARLDRAFESTEKALGGEGGMRGGMM